MSETDPFEGLEKDQEDAIFVIISDLADNAKNYVTQQLEKRKGRAIKVGAGTISSDGSKPKLSLKGLALVALTTAAALQMWVFSITLTGLSKLFLPNQLLLCQNETYQWKKIKIKIVHTKKNT